LASLIVNPQFLAAEGPADSKAEVFAGLIAMCIWFALFVAGTFIGTKPYRETLAGQADVGQKLQALFITLFCYTATNIAMLCCIASVLGGIFRRMRERQRQRLLVPSLLVLLLSLILQGFVVYLVIASGVISFGGWDHFLDNPSQDQYLRLAATCSLISLVIGYSPGLFNSLMGRLEKWVQQRPTDPELKGTPPGHPSREGMEG
jgi:hypothetical protein